MLAAFAIGALTLGIGVVLGASLTHNKIDPTNYSDKEDI